MGEDSKWHRARRSEGVVLVALFALAVLSFTAVSALSSSYRARQRHVAEALFSRGELEAKANRPQEAARTFRAALNYSPDDFSYQLALAEALTQGKRTSEAIAYLQNLWDQQPADGRVNLELARNYAARGDTDLTIRHYQNAIYSVWNSDPDANRRAVRFELVHFLLDRGMEVQAEAELIALAGNLSDDTILRNQVAALFLQTHNYSRALNQYGRVLQLDPKNVEALRGAGHAAFLAGEYATARRFLSEAVHLVPHDPDTERALQVADLVIESDPANPHVTDAERRRRVIAAFRAAGARLDQCLTSKGPTQTLSELSEKWSALRSKVTDRTLARDAAVSRSAMDVVFAIELKTEDACNSAQGTDLALLLLSKDQAGAER